MATYTLISSNVLSSSAASVTFSAIPSTYTDLVLKISARSDSAGLNDIIQMDFNGSDMSNQSSTYLRGGGNDGASSQRDSTLSFRINAASSTANTFANTEMYIPSYTISQYKPFSTYTVTENNGSTAYLQAIAALKSSTTAISSIYLAGAGNFVSGSSFYLYGISNA